MTNAEKLLEINTRKEKLKSAGEDLKKYFIGTDAVIDQVIKGMEAWYVMPEAIARPVIINLWGMTGVGKTDLVRKLVKLLGLSHSFLEIQLSNKGVDTSGSWGSSISAILEDSNIEEGKPGILMLDEIQRFRTVDDDGKDIHDVRYQDLWMLLSDGKFSSSSRKEAILDILLGEYYWSIQEKTEDKKTKKAKKEDEIKKEKGKYSQSVYTAKRMKRALRLTEPIEEIMTWSDEQKLNIVEERLKSDATYDNIDYSKLLIFVSGNLDAAYSMSEGTSDADSDADAMHEDSKKVDVIKIKKVLKKRFKPEQISRLGNFHVIYPSLSKDSYNKIIQKRMNEITATTSNNHGIKITIDPSVNDFLYRNGVFPSQGVRPVLSTVNAYLENSIPSIIIFALQNDLFEIAIECVGEELVVASKDKRLTISWNGQLDQIKKKRTRHEVAMIAVHEAGHAVAHSILMKTPPKQIIVGALENPFVETDEFNYLYSKNRLLNYITVCLSGRAAEKVVFGDDLVTGGASGDIETATNLAVKAVKVLGFYAFGTTIMAPHHDMSNIRNHMSEDATSLVIDQVVKDQIVVANKLMEKNKDVVIKLAKTLIAKDRKRMTCDEACRFFNNNGIPVSKRWGTLPRYADKLEESVPEARKMREIRLKVGVTESLMEIEN